MEKKSQDMVSKEVMIQKVRAAIQDRAIWFALLFDEFSTVLPEEKVVELCKKAIYKFGLLKATKDPVPFSAKEWVDRHREKGSADIFDSDIEYSDLQAIQKMKHCALVEAWKEMSLSREKIELFCDIVTEGDRGRANGHADIDIELHETIAKGCDYCRLIIF